MLEEAAEVAPPKDGFPDRVESERHALRQLFFASIRRTAESIDRSLALIADSRAMLDGEPDRGGRR